MQRTRTGVYRAKTGPPSGAVKLLLTRQLDTLPAVRPTRGRVTGTLRPPRAVRERAEPRQPKCSGIRLFRSIVEP